MLWTLWLMLIVLVPAGAGVVIWWQLQFDGTKSAEEQTAQPSTNPGV